MESEHFAAVESDECRCDASYAFERMVKAATFAIETCTEGSACVSFASHRYKPGAVNFSGKRMRTPIRVSCTSKACLKMNKRRQAVGGTGAVARFVASDERCDRSALSRPAPPLGVTAARLRLVGLGVSSSTAFVAPPLVSLELCDEKANYT
jgi:hypothetical protein